MNKLLSKILLGLFLTTFIACSNEQEDKLKEKFSEEIKITPQYKKGKNAREVLQQYIEMEQSINLRFVNQLQELIDNSFEKKLERFIEEEFDYFSNLGNWWNKVTGNEIEFQDRMKLMADKYFNNLDTQQEAQGLYDKYVDEIDKLRSTFYKTKGINEKQERLELNIQKDDVSISGMDKHASKFWLAETISNVDLGIFSTFIELDSEEKIIESLRQQHKETSLDYQSILNNLDKNTVKFYEKYK
jgi:rubrerythrin